MDVSRTYLMSELNFYEWPENCTLNSYHWRYRRKYYRNDWKASECTPQVMKFRCVESLCIMQMHLLLVGPWLIGYHRYPFGYSVQAAPACALNGSPRSRLSQSSSTGYVLLITTFSKGIDWIEIYLLRHGFDPRSSDLYPPKSRLGGYTSYEFRSLKDWLEYRWKKCFLSKKFIWTGFETTVESPTIPNGERGESEPTTIGMVPRYSRYFD